MNWALVDRLVADALREDVASGDLTTEALIGEADRARGEIWAQSRAVVCGLPVAERVFRALDPQIRLQSPVGEGGEVAEGELVAIAEGQARALLTGERCALNFLQRLSGIATLTRQFVNAVGDAPVRILDTRKTTPLLRLLEKYAVRVGGGHNHRMGLHDGVLIKDNHIALVGSVREAVLRAKQRCPHGMRVQVEVANLAQAEEALSAGADALLADNMSAEEVRRVVEAAKGRAFVEASGGVTLVSVAEFAAAGVDAISVGALTHSAPAANFSLLLRPLQTGEEIVKKF